MKVNIILLLLSVCIILQQIVIQKVLKDIKLLQENQEVLRQGINILDKKISK